MNPKRIDFGKWLQSKREIAGLTQIEASKKLGLKNGHSFVSQWESAFSAVPIDKIFDICEIYNIDINEMIKKLEEYEPSIYKKFTVLKTKFFKYYSDSFRTFTEIRAHHRNFISDNNGIVNHDNPGRLYIMSTNLVIPLEYSLIYLSPLIHLFLC